MASFHLLSGCEGQSKSALGSLQYHVCLQGPRGPFGMITASVICLTVLEKLKLEPCGGVILYSFCCCYISFSL